MTMALVGYSGVFMRYAFAVTPANYLLFGCHAINFTCQSVQSYRYLNYWKYVSNIVSCWLQDMLFAVVQFFVVKCATDMGQTDSAVERRHLNRRQRSRQTQSLTRLRVRLMRRVQRQRSSVRRLRMPSRRSLVRGCDRFRAGCLSMGVFVHVDAGY